MLAALLLATAWQGPDLAPAKPLPDVVVFVLDDVADTDLDAIPTPNIDALAATGVRFRRAYAHAWCAPTRDSMTFSLWLGLDRGDSCTAPGVWSHPHGDFSIAKYFEGRGYGTCHLGKLHVGSTDLGGWELAPHMFGFDAVRAGHPIGPTCSEIEAARPRLDDGVVSVERGDDSIVLRDEFLRWWAETPAPRFAFVNLAAGHKPFDYPPRSILPPGYQTPLNGSNRRRFDAEIVGADFVIGQMLQVVGPEAWVVVTSDNGTPPEATRQDQDPEKVKKSCYEDGVRVPLIVNGPRVSPGLESSNLVHLVDLVPTLAELVDGCTLPVPVDGLSFAGGLTGERGLRSQVLAWNPTRGDVAAIGRRWKLLRDQDGVESLFDLELDPLEMDPLPARGPVAFKLRRWRNEVLGTSKVPLIKRR